MFKKQFFPEKTIKSIATNQSIYEKGLSLFNNNKINNLSLNETNRSVEFIINDYQEVKAFLSFSEKGLAQKYSCNCPAFKKQSGACEHVVASMFYLNTIKQDSFSSMGKDGFTNKNNQQDTQLQTIQRNREALDNLFNQAKKDVDAQTISFTKTPLQCEFVLNMNPIAQDFEYNLFLKIGVDHLYVIQDILEVADFLLKEKSYTFGKQLTYTPEDYSIMPEDRNLLSYIYELGMTQEATFEMVHGGRKPERDGSMVIPPKNMSNILEMLTKVDRGYVRQGAQPRLLSSISDLQIPEVQNVKDEIPLTFELIKEEDHYLFDLATADKDKIITIHPQANIINIDSVFYILNSEKFKNASLVLNTIKNMNKEPLKLTKNDLSSFYSLILPKIREVFSCEIDRSIEDKVKQAPLNPKLYIDYADQQLRIRPIFEYDDKKINPLNEKDNPEKTEVFVRDIFRENDILNVLNHFFKQGQVLDGEYVLNKFKDISLFLYDSLVEISNLMDVFLTSDVEKLIYDKKINPSLSIEMDNETNLLNIHFDVADIEDDDLPGLVRQLKNTTNRFYKLNTGQIIDLEENDFSEFLDNIDKLNLEPEEISEHTSVSLLRGLSFIEDEKVSIGEEFKEFIQELKEPENLFFEVPETLNATLRPYQETGFKWLSMLDYYGLGGVLADDMGLGKTIQTITFILSKSNKVDGKYLVVSPSSVVYNWEREFSQFAPNLSTAIISGTIEEREKQLEEAIGNEETDVLITSYPLIQRDIEYYKKYNFQTIILDESQNVKNDTAKTTQAVKQLQSNNIFALSGTPIENNLNELWSLFSIVLPGLFQSKKIYNELTESEIANRINIFILRRLKEDVLDDLPPKTETVEFIELSEEQKRLYQTQLSLIRDDVEELIEHDTFEQNRMRVLAGMTRLRQICCDPRLVDENYTGESAKLNRLMEYLEEAFENKKRVVLFSQFTSMLAIIRNILDKQGVEYHYLDGNTPKKDRLDLTTRFNDGEKELFLISLRAGGTGLNLTGGDTVILYDSWWNPAIEDQAADRVHRFGQKEPVQVIRMIMKGTIEEGINELQEQKRELIDSVIHKNEEEEEAASLTKGDILRLLSE